MNFSINDLNHTYKNSTKDKLYKQLCMKGKKTVTIGTLNNKIVILNNMRINRFIASFCAEIRVIYYKNLKFQAMHSKIKLGNYNKSSAFS